MGVHGAHPRCVESVPTFNYPNDGVKRSAVVSAFVEIFLAAGTGRFVEEEEALKYIRQLKR